MLRYGGTREQVLGVEAVLGTGDVVSHLAGLVKDNTGYHLPSLLCGSEGTLGIVTAARLRLVRAVRADRRPRWSRSTSVDEAVAARRRVRPRARPRSKRPRSCSTPGVRLVCDVVGAAPPFDRAWPVYVLVEAADHTDPTDRLAEVVAGTDGRPRRRGRDRRPRRAGAVAPPRGAHRGDRHRRRPAQARRHAAARRGWPSSSRDVAERVAAAVPGASTWLFGHVGDGNIHVNVTGAGPDDERVDDVVLALRRRARRQHQRRARDRHRQGRVAAPRTAARPRSHAMRAIKRALDPDGILNPAVLVAPSVSTAVPR